MLKTKMLLIMATMCMALALNAQKQSKVYVTRDISPEALVRIYKALGRPAKGRVAIKISTGEENNPNSLSPALIKDLVDLTDGTLVECNTAYGGERGSIKQHRRVIEKHGYDRIATVDLMDEDGEYTIPVRDTKWIKHDIVGTHLKNYDFMINLAHFKGHPMGGLGGVIKNQSIGVASANGKANIHTAGHQEVVEGMWNHVENQDGFLESMAAASQGVADVFGRNIIYISVMNNMSVDCDCVDHPEPVKLKDYGILASLDPVALDQACADIVFGIKPSEGNDNRPLIERINKQHGLHTIEYAEQIGFGTRNYKLVSIDKKLQDNPSKRLVLHYDFIKANGQTVPDLTSNHFDGKLYGSAQVIHEGKEHYVSLGNEQGYIDLGEEIGFHLKGMTTFSIAVRYKVAETASLQGNGYFLWAFSTLEQNTQDRGRYQAYKLNVQRSENSVGGWNRETMLDVGRQSQKGEWIHVVYTQEGQEGRLYIDGKLVAQNPTMYTMSETFPWTEAPTFNWMGRAPFRGDSYLAGASISDVRIYSTALSETAVKKLCK